jgi:hypothetical protein
VRSTGGNNDSQQQPEILAAEISSLLDRDENARAGAIEIAGDASARRPNTAFLELSLSHEEIGIALCATDDRSAAAFLEWLNTGEAIRRLPGLEGFVLVVLERRAENHVERYTAKRAKWAPHGTPVELERIAADAIDEDALERIATRIRSFDARWERPAFNLGTRLPRTAPLDLSAHVANELSAHVRALLPILGRVRAGARQAASSRAPALERAPWRAPR